MNTKSDYLSGLPQTRGAFQETNAPFLYYDSDKIDTQAANYARQSGLEVLNRTVSNLLPNVALEAVRGVGNLYELGKRGANLIDSKDFSINNLLFGNFDKDDNDFGNVLTKFADKNQNPFGEIYTRSTDTFDVSSPAWWAKSLSSTLPTVIEFAGESALIGSGIARAGLKLAEYLNLGVRGAKDAKLVAQGLTSFLVTKHESYMMAGQTYDKVYNDYLNRFLADNPFASEDEQEAIKGKAKEAAGRAASAVDGIYTALALPFNITGLNSIFNHSGDDIYSFFRNQGSKLTRDEVDQLSTKNPFIAKALEKQKAFNGTLVREAGFEGFEEVEGQFAQEAGERFQDKKADTKGAIDQLDNFFKYTLNEEGALNFFLGSFMGGTQTAILENAPIHKVDKLNFDGKPSIVYDKEGKPVVQKEWVNARTRDVYGKQILFDDYKKAIVHDLDYVSGIQDQIAKSNDPIERDNLKRELFHIQAFDSVKKGIGDNLINSIKQIVSIDNTESIVKPLEDQIDQLDKQIIPQREGEELTDDEKQQNLQIQQQLDEMRKEYLNNKDTTSAMQSGLAVNKEDNLYKIKGEQAINHIKDIQKFYDTQKQRFREEGKGLAEYATELYSTVKGNDQVIADRTLDLEKEKANIGLFNSVDDLADLDSYYQNFSFEQEKKKLEDIDKAVIAYSKDSSQANQKELEKFVNSTGKDTWTPTELAQALQEEQKKNTQLIQEKSEAIRNNIRNSPSYQSFLNGKEDSDEKINDYIKQLNSKNVDLSDYARLQHNLNDYTQRNNYLKDRLKEITSSTGSEAYINKAIQKVEIAKKALENKINILSYAQAKAENANYFYINKVRTLNQEHIKVIDQEINNIKTKVRDLVTETKTSTVKTYFDSFVERFTKAKTNEDLIKRYEARIDQLEEYKAKILQNQKIEEIKVSKATTETQKAKIVEEKKEQIKADIQTGVDTSAQDSLFSEDEVNASTEVKQPPVQIVPDIIIPSGIAIDEVKFAKQLKSLKDFLNQNPVDFIKSNYDALKSLKGAKQILDYLVSEKVITDYDSDFEDESNIDVSEAKKLSRIVADIKVETPRKEVPSEVKKAVEEVKQEVKQARDSSKELINYLDANKTYKEQKVEPILAQYIESIQKSNKIKFDSQATDSAIDYITKKFTLKRTPRNDYQLGIKISNLFYDLTNLEKYNQEVKDFESKLAELDVRPSITIPSTVQEEVLKVEENPVETISIEQEKVAETENNRIANEVVPNFISYKSNESDKVTIVDRYKNLFDPKFLNVGDKVSFKVLSKESKTPDNIDIEIYKGDTLVGYLPINIFSRLPYSVRDNANLFDQIKVETQTQQQQLKQLRDLLFALPEGSTVQTSLDQKTGGFHLRANKKSTLSESGLLADSRIKLMLADNAGGTNNPDYVQFRESTNEVVSVDDISNYSSYSKALPKVSLWIKYPNVLPNKFNIIPANIGTIEQDLDVIREVFNQYGKSKSDVGRIDFIKTIKDQLDYDLDKVSDFESFINQYFTFTFNKDNLDKRQHGLSILPDGDIALKVNGETVFLNKNKKPSPEFLNNLGKFAKVANKNVTLTSETKNYKSGINQTASFLAPVFDKGLQIKTFANYNDYISNYVSTDLTKAQNTPTNDPVYVTAPIYKFNVNELINNLQEKEAKVEEVVKAIVEKESTVKKKREKKDITDTTANKFDFNVEFVKSTSVAKQLLLDLSKKSFYDLKFNKATGMMKGAISFTINDKLKQNQNGYSNLLNQITKLNNEQFDGFPVIQSDSKEVSINVPALTVYQKTNSSKELDMNIVEMYKQVQKTVGLKDRNLYLTQIANSTTEEQLGKVLKNICL